MANHSDSSALQHPDQRFIEGLRRQDSAIIREIYTRYSGPVTNWVLKNNGDQEQAKDLFQEGLIQLFLIASDPDFQLRCTFGYFFTMICKRKWIDLLRKNKKEQDIRFWELSRINSEEQIHPSEEERLETLLEKETLLDQTFGQLSELCQKLLVLIRKGVPVQSIQDQLDMNAANTVYQRKRACTQRWMQLFQEQWQKREV